ncbi:MAG: GNAT family N-acetyltransferase, partial [Fimbriimonas sp.]
ATALDGVDIWNILEPVIREGEYFAYERDMTRADLDGLWHGPGREVFVAEIDGQVVGTYYIKPNQAGGGSHVANGGYATAPSIRGKGVARAMCLHSLEIAKQRGFRAMQFNFVVSSNERAVNLWLSLGFRIMGTVPKAFERPDGSEVGVHIMHREL